MSIVIEQISKSFDNNRIIDKISLAVEDKEFSVLLGPSGCGKSTILRIIAGLILPDEGRILLNGRDITWLPPQQRGMGFVFQNYSFFPHMNISENIEFGLKIRNMPRSERQARQEYLFRLVGMEGMGSRYASQLSGGQMQRVALARSLAYEPRVLLLDEPFAVVDVKTRIQLRHSLKKIVKEIGVTTVMVTHDQEEAFELAERIAIVNNGCIEQYDYPSNVYYNPSTQFTADFVGNINFFEGRIITSSDEICEIELFGHRKVYRRGYYPFQTGQQVLYGVRPEQIRVSLLEPESYENGIDGVIEKRMFLGDITRYAIRLTNNRLLDVQVLNYLFVEGMVMPYELNEQVWLIWSHGSGIVLAGQEDTRRRTN